MSRAGKQQVAVVACCAALATLVPVALFQGEVINALPDPAGEIFASERITLSKTAHPLGIPDSYLGLASYSATLALLLLSRRSPLARRLAGAKLALDASVAGFNVMRQVVVFGKICSWCTGTALATAAMAVGGRELMAATAADARQVLRKI